MHYIIVLTLLLASLYAKQSDFSLIIDKPFNDALLDITEDYDRGISAVGFSKNYKQSSGSSNKTYTNAFEYLESLSDTQGSQMHLIKVDNSANIVLSKAAKLSRFNKAVAVVKTPSDGYFIGGYTLDGELLILKLTSNTTTIFNKRFGTKNYDRMNNLILLSDGGVLAIGSSITSRDKRDSIFETGLGLNDIFLTRFSKDGKKLWSKKYGTLYDDRGIDAVEAKDGSIIVVSSTSYNKNRDITLMRITQNGDKIWLKHYKQEQLITPHKIIKLRDNNFLLSLSQKSDTNKNQVRIIKFDLQKNILLDKEIHTTYSSALKDIKEFSNGRLIGVGFVRDSYDTNALVMLLDSELDLLYQDHFGDENFDSFNAATILHNSQVAVAGINTDENSQESNMWIVKLNRDGSLAQKSTKVTNFYDELLKLFKPEIDANRLTIKEDLTIEFTEELLYFKVGKYKLTTKQKKFLTKFSDKLIPFLKANRDYIETLEINGHTSSEWGSANFNSRFLKNEKLSMNRSYSTISYIFQKQNRPTQVWLTKVLRGSGFSYSKKVTLNDSEDRKKSRRVSFKIILK
ncbi:MAG: OmpA family protein [Campylobacterota bacterium]|nr:OmpA family protein [Campylobacterota bacterium]